MTVQTTQRPVCGDSGFTIPELLSVMVVTAILSGLVIFFAFNYWRSTATLNTDLSTFVGRLTASDRLRAALNVSSGLINQNSIPDNNTGDPDPSDPTNTHWVPLHAVPTTITMGSAGTITPVLYFKSPSVDSSENIIYNGTQPYEDEHVLYMNSSNGELLMRTLANPDAPSNAAVTTCPPPSATSTCPADRLIAENISGVGMRYFSKSGLELNYESIVDSTTGAYIGPDMPAVDVVELTLDVFKKATVNGGADTSSQTVVRVALRNT